MTGKDILKLVKAGFDLDQILSIDEALGLPGETEPDDQVKIEPEQKADPQPGAAEAIAAATDKLVSVLDKIQKANVGGKEQPASEVETTDDILAQMIMGKKPGKEA